MKTPVNMSLQDGNASSIVTHKENVNLNASARALLDVILSFTNLTRLSNPQDASEDSESLGDDDDFNYMETYLNSFPDELEIYRRKGCQFMKSQVVDEDEGDTNNEK